MLVAIDTQFRATELTTLLSFDIKQGFWERSLGALPGRAGYSTP